MLAIIFIESHDCKNCVGTHLALRNGTQNYAKGALLDLEGALCVFRKGRCGFLKGHFCTVCQKGGPWPPWPPGSYVPLTLTVVGTCAVV